MNESIYNIIKECDFEKEWIYPVQDLCVDFDPRKYSLKEVATLFKFLSENQDELGIPDLDEFKKALISYNSCSLVLEYLTYYFPSLDTVNFREALKLSRGVEIHRRRYSGLRHYD